LEANLILKPIFWGKNLHTHFFSEFCKHGRFYVLNSSF